MNKVFLRPLQQLGWARVCSKSPNFAARIGHEILLASEWDGGKRYKADLAALNKFCAGVREVVLNYEALSSTSKNMVNSQANLFVGADIESASPNHFEELFLALDPIVSAVLGYENLLSEEVSSLPHPKRNTSAHLIAMAIAELHVVGLGEKPRLGKDQGTYELNGAFAKAAFQVFEILEIPCSRQTATPFKAAIDSLTDEKMENLLHLHRIGEPNRSLAGGGRRRRGISLSYDFDILTGRRCSEMPSKGLKAPNKNPDSPLD
jgi:hypothetical protein